MSERHNKYGCPSDRELELFSLDEIASARVRSSINSHLQECPRCSRKSRHFRAFYATLSKELDHSFSPALIDYAKHRAPRSVKYGLLVCEPVSAKNSRKGRAYLATLAFSANGDGSKSRLVDFDLPQNAIGIMLYTDPQRKEMLMFLWSREAGDFDQWWLTIPMLNQKIKFNRLGFSKIPLTNFENLNNHLVYFSIVQEKKSPERVLEKIQNMIV
jgi:hypothetical protein